MSRPEREQHVHLEPTRKGRFFRQTCTTCGEPDVAHRWTTGEPHGLHVAGERHQKALAGACVTCGVTFKPGEHRREAVGGGHEHGAGCPVTTEGGA